MNKLVILNYTTNSVDIYDVDPNTIISDEYLINLGYNTSNCVWMFGKATRITYHEEVLK